MHVHKRLEVAHCLVTLSFRLLLLWLLSNDLVLNPLLAFSLFGLPNWRTDGRAAYTASGNAADVNHSKAVAFRYRRGLIHQWRWSHWIPCPLRS